MKKDNSKIEKIAINEANWFCSNDDKRYKGPFNFKGVIKFLSNQKNKEVYIFSAKTNKKYSFGEISEIYSKQFEGSLSNFLHNSNFSKTGNFISFVHSKSKSKLDALGHTKVIIKDDLYRINSKINDNDQNLHKSTPPKNSNEIFLDDTTTNLAEYLMWLLLAPFMYIALRIFGIIPSLSDMYSSVRNFLYPYLN